RPHPASFPTRRSSDLVRTEKRLVLVELREQDRVAYGEASPDPFFGETPESLEADVRSALELLPEDPRDLAGLRARLDARFPHGGDRKSTRLNSSHGSI